MASTVNNKKIAVIGGGAAGLIASITAKKSNPSCIVTVFEAKDTCGKKINATGNGKCNFTNLNMGSEFYRSNTPDFTEYGLSVFGARDTIRFFNEIGIPEKNRNGYIYPMSEEASSVSQTLRLSAIETGVILKEGVTAEPVLTKNGFLVNKEAFDKCIIACGSFAGIKDRKSFNGYDLVKKLGHNITPLYPALCQIRCRENFFKTINGVRTDALIAITVNEILLTSERGELLFTDYGISGIPSFILSRHCAKAVDEGNMVNAIIDFMPDVSSDQITAMLLKRADYKRTAEEALLGILNHKLNYVLLNQSGINPTADANTQLNSKKINNLVSNIKQFKLSVIGTNDYSYAQVIAGGADLNQIDNKTMESKIVPGLFFAGEIMDVDGTCGGYNLQWAWTSGYIAGLNASK